MALIDLTNVNPWAQELDAQRRANAIRQQAYSGAFDSLQRSLQAGIERRQRQEAQYQQIRDREYALINTETNKLFQDFQGRKVTDVQLQQTGQKIKQEYYDAVKAYQDSDKGDEARQAFETAKQKALGSARTISGALDKITAQVATFQNAYKNGGVSNAVNPAVREFMADLASEDTPEDQYQITSDDQGRLKYTGTTTGGTPVDFYLEDIANGDNAFQPIAKQDMPGIVANLAKDVTLLTRQEKYDWGTAEVTDWENIGPQLQNRMDKLLTDENNFRAIAAELGFGYEVFEAAKNEQLTEGFAVDDDIYDISNIDDLKDAVKKELMDQIEYITPHRQNVIEVAQQQAPFENAAQTSAQFTQAVESKDANAFNGYLGKSAIVNGFKGNIYEITPGNNNKVKIVVRSGNKGETKEFDLNKPDQLALFQSIVTGQDYNLIKQANINSIVNNTLLE